VNICKAPFFFFFASSIFTSRQIAGSQGNAGRAGAEFSRAEPSLRSSAGVVAGWAPYEAAAAL
jgi:hypothetical protein